MARKLRHYMAATMIAFGTALIFDRDVVGVLRHLADEIERGKA